MNQKESERIRKKHKKCVFVGTEVVEMKKRNLNWYCTPGDTVRECDTCDKAAHVYVLFVKRHTCASHSKRVPPNTPPPLFRPHPHPFSPLPSMPCTRSTHAAPSRTSNCTSMAPNRHEYNPVPSAPRFWFNPRMSNRNTSDTHCTAVATSG